MGRRTPAVLALAVATLVAAVLTALAPATAGSARAGSLSVSPPNGQFTAGQELTFTGSIGAAGRRAVRLQSNMGRSGDTWRDVVGAKGRTNASGAFTVRTQAPSMEGIHYRVVSGSRRTPVWTSQVRHQDVSLRVEGSGLAVVGEPLTVRADTSMMPLLPGRALTLQQRTSPTSWVTVAGATLGADGTASFALTPKDPGTVVYRVRMEDWNVGVGHVGWFPSYPLYVDVLSSAPTDRSASTSGRTGLPVAARALTAPAQTTASRTYRWGTPRYDFDWEVGESLTDKAALGTRRRGSWLDGSDGTGRVALRNGAMQLSSQVEGPLNDSRGSTWATLQRNTQTYGRWETRVMPMTFRSRSADYRIRAELVPADPAQERCGAQNITIFDMTPSQSGIQIGAKALTGAQWTRTVSGISTNNAFHAFGIEVTKNKITWFVDGRPVGKVSDAAAVPDVPMTVRVSMVGVEGQSMTTTRTLVDWVRSWQPGTGAKTKGGASLSTGTHTPLC